MFLLILFVLISLNNSKAISVNETIVEKRKFTSDCGQIFNEKQFILESPNYPTNYPINYDCSYLLKGPFCPTTYNIQFLDFNLEDSTGCTKDRLEIDNQDAICGTKSGIKNYYTVNGVLVVRFVSDSDKTGRGFRILVTRQPCQNAPPTTTPFNAIPNDVETASPLLPKCCLNQYKTKNFLLVSPNFPYSMATQTECIYQIFKYNSNVCRLRIIVDFFWLGGGKNCSEGYLNINDKYICGCQMNLKLIHPFNRNNDGLMIKFKSLGLIRNSFSGFLINIIQDECPKRQINKRFASVNLEKLNLLNEYSRNSNNILEQFYYFSDELAPREREETTFLDTFTINTVLEGDQNYNLCLYWNRRQFYDIYNRYASVLRTYCTQSQTAISSPKSRRCIELNYVKGYFKSPGYPLYYPGNLNICYRFIKQPGYCTLRVQIRDFNIQSSENCERDYFSIGAQNYKYCGDMLQNSYMTINMENKQYEQVDFVTDPFYCGRGFFGTFEQIACRDMTYPIEITHPITLSPPTTTPILLESCDQIYQNKAFQLEVNDKSQSTCLFSINKFHPDVCKLKLYFANFNLICTVESLIIDDRMYCGHLTGKTVFVDLTERNSLNIIYKKNSQVPENSQRFLIKGLQILDECPVPPAERLLLEDRLHQQPLTESSPINNTQSFNKSRNNKEGD